MKRYFLDLSVSQLYGITILIVICLANAWWYFLYSPLIAYNIQACTETDILQSQLYRCELLEKECNALEQKCKSLKSTCNNLIKKFQTHDPHAIIHAILSCAHDHKLTLINCETSAAKNTENIIHVSYVFKSSYENIIDFFSCLESSGYLHQIASYELTKISETEISCLLKYEFSKVDLIA